jgi:hypothetical protein
VFVISFNRRELIGACLAIPQHAVTAPDVTAVLRDSLRDVRAAAEQNREEFGRRIAALETEFSAQRSARSEAAAELTSQRRARGRATVWTCDLTHGYIDINGSYRSCESLVSEFGSCSAALRFGAPVRCLQVVSF